MSQKTSVDEEVRKLLVTSTQSDPHRVGINLERFDKDDEAENWPFCGLVGRFVWLSTSTCSDISNTVPAVRYTFTALHRKLSTRK